ncbi:MAG: HAMP domain-containing sensor histidine kinase, partial [Aggregatilineales bacterium]
AEAVRKDQTVFDVELTFSRIPQDPDHIVCTCHDISHLKETERIKDNFISMVTHELRTPITTLTLISSTLMTHYDRMTEDQRRVRMGHLQTQAGVLRELVESVLDISRLNARNMEFGNTVVDITDAASHVMNELAQTALEKDVALHAELPDTSVMVCGETVDISRIWRNLISNAIKYTDAGGEIVVRLGEMQVSQDHEWRSNLTLPASIPALQAGHYCVGQVADTGHGMDARDIDGLFVRFFRGWAKQSPIPGTGLGLSLVKELLEAYHGNICVESEPGIGSTFTFWLPIYSDQTKEGIR